VAAYRIVADAGTVIGNTCLGRLDETVSTRRSTVGYVAVDGAGTAVAGEVDGHRRFAGRCGPSATGVDEHPSYIHLCCRGRGSPAHGLRDGISPFQRRVAGVQHCFRRACGMGSVGEATRCRLPLLTS